MEIVMPHSGEFVDLEKMDDTQLLMFLEQLKEYEKQFKITRSLVGSQFIQRMQAKGASKHEDGMYRATIKTKFEYDYNIPLLLSLKNHLTEQQFKEAVKVEYKPNKTELNKLVKFGGDVKQIIEEATIPIPKDELVVERMAQGVSA